jgi:hypothetical protein
MNVERLIKCITEHSAANTWMMAIMDGVLRLAVLVFGFWILIDDDDYYSLIRRNRRSRRSRLMIRPSARRPSQSLSLGALVCYTGTEAIIYYHHLLSCSRWYRKRTWGMPQQ